MRVVGYVREQAGLGDGESAFAQQEKLRRHAAANGYGLVATCQDLHRPGEPSSRDGYRSLLGVIAAGGVDAVLLPGLNTLSSDQIVQEIMLWDLRGRGVRVVSTDDADVALLDAEVPPGPARMLIRDVLTRVGEHARSLGSTRPDAPEALPDGDVLVHILQADEAEAASEGRPAAG